MNVQLLKVEGIAFRPIGLEVIRALGDALVEVLASWDCWSGGGRDREPVKQVDPAGRPLAPGEPIMKSLSPSPLKSPAALTGKPAWSVPVPWKTAPWGVGIGSGHGVCWHSR